MLWEDFLQHLHFVVVVDCHLEEADKLPNISCQQFQFLLRRHLHFAIVSVDVLNELAAGNSEYEKKFGYIFIVCATGKSAQEMLDLLKKRLPNSPEAELKIAAREQNKITHLRLDKLFS